MMKKKLSAIVLATMFVSPVFADDLADDLSGRLQSAINSSDAIQAEIENIKSAYQEFGVARATMDLSTSLSASNSTSERSINDADSYDIENNNLTLTITKPIYDGGMASSKENIAELGLDLAIMSYRSAEQQAILDALTAHVNLVSARQSLSVNQSNVERLQEQVKASTLRLELGESTPTQLALAQSRLARAEAGLILAQASLDDANAAYLRYFHAPADMKLDLPILPQMDQFFPASAGLAGDVAISYNPAYRQLVINERITRKNMDTLLANVRPNVDFSISGTTTDSNIDTSNIDAVTASITLTTPLYPTSATRAKSRGLVADHQSILRSLADMEQDIRLGAENAYRNFLAASSLINANETESEAAILFRDGVEKEVQFGLKSLLDLLDAQQDVVSAEQSLIKARGDYVLAGYALLMHMGKLNADTFGLTPAFVSVDALPIHDIPFSGIIPRVTYPE